MKRIHMKPNFKSKFLKIKTYLLEHVFDLTKDRSEKYEKVVLGIIILNCLIIFLQETGFNYWWINMLDALCTIAFLIEMIWKQKKMGIANYWKSGWNFMDGLLVIISLPSLVSYVCPIYNTSWILVLRLFRIFRFFRIVRLWDGAETTFNNIKKAIKNCFSVFVGFAVLLFVCALVSCALFKDLSPQFFGTPLESLYSIFRMCTIEGWYEIPNSVAAGGTIWMVHFVRIYFIVILMILGIIGMSIINSIFVDAMVSDNNDDLKEQIKQLDKKIDALIKAQNFSQKGESKR